MVSGDRDHDAATGRDVGHTLILIWDFFGIWVLICNLLACLGFEICFLGIFFFFFGLVCCRLCDGFDR